MTIQHHSKFLVSFCNQTTPSSGNVVLLDVEEKITTVIPLQDYGVTGLKTSVDKKYVFAIYQSEPTIINIFSLETFQLVCKQLLPEVKDVHGMFIEKDLLFITSTGTDSIEVYRFNPETISFSFERTFWTPEDSHHTDQHHLNSIYKKGDDFLITMYYSEKPDESNERKGFIYNISKNQKIDEIPDIFHPHSLNIVENDIWYCESATQSVKKNGETILEFQNTGYIRGLAVTQKYIALGVSSFRSISRHTNKINNYADSGVPTNVCKVKIFDRNTLKLVTTFDFFPEHSEVFGIIPL